MISKDLLSEVLGINYKFTIQESKHYELNTIKWWKLEAYKEEMVEINIYELAHKCKEWAETLGNGYSLTSSTTDEYNMAGCEDSQWMCEIVYYPNDVFYAGTEPKAIFKACEYILNNKDKQ